MITWILVANSAEAKILTSENLRIVSELKLLRELQHSNSRKKVTDLMPDKPGHYKVDSGMRGSFTKNDPKEVEAEHFAIQLVNELKSGLDKNHYKHLVIVTPAHFYGLIEKHMGSHFLSGVTRPDITHISKDYTKHPLAKLAESLKEHLFP